MRRHQGPNKGQFVPAQCRFLRDIADDSIDVIATSGPDRYQQHVRQIGEVSEAGSHGPQGRAWVLGAPPVSENEPMRRGM
jgi:hypothetical protein